MAKKNKYERKVVPSRADEREARTGMRQSKGAMIAKIVLGGLFFAVSFDHSDGEWSIGYFLFCLILAGGMIAWGLLPYLEARRQGEPVRRKKRPKGRMTPSRQFPVGYIRILCYNCWVSL